jgi:hypothetical protein
VFAADVTADGEVCYAVIDSEVQSLIRKKMPVLKHNKFNVILKNNAKY